jgi:hypothetical protein
MLDIAKIFIGSLTWIGGFVVFVRLKEKSKKIASSMIRIESIK